MKVKVSETTNTQLDWLVAKCEGYVPLYENAPTANLRNTLGNIVHLDDRHYSTDWGLGGPILTEACISRTINLWGLWIAYWADGYGDGDEANKWMQCDRSELVAGLRCYVASELGDEVEVPDEIAHQRAQETWP